MNTPTPVETARLIVCNENNETIVAWRPLNSKQRPGDLDIPGGKVDPEETPAQAAIRELREETGICVSEEKLLWVYAVTERDGGQWYSRYYFKHLGAVCMPNVIDLTEHTAFDIMPKDRAIELTHFAAHQAALACA